MLDMLKDVGGKTPDKCVALTDPSKAGSRVAESMPALLVKIRHISVWSRVLQGCCWPLSSLK